MIVMKLGVISSRILIWMLVIVKYFNSIEIGGIYEGINYRC